MLVLARLSLPVSGYLTSTTQDRLLDQDFLCHQHLQQICPPTKEGLTTSGQSTHLTLSQTTLASIMAKTTTKKTREELRAEKSDCHCRDPDPYAPSSRSFAKLVTNRVDRNNTILCDAEEGCLNWYHFHCEKLTVYLIGDIDKYAYIGCLKEGLGQTTYKGYNPEAEIPDDAVTNEDESDDEDDDEDVDLYITESDSANDSDGSEGNSNDTESSSDDSEPYSDSTESESDESDESDYQEPVTACGKRKAAAQPGQKRKAQKTSKQAAFGSHKPLASGRLAPSRPVHRRFQPTDSTSQRSLAQLPQQLGGRSDSQN